MSTLQQIVPVAQLVGLSSASALSGMYLQQERRTMTDFPIGYIASVSFMSVPSILVAPSADLAARQWKKLYDMGKASAPPFAVTCAACFSFLAYHC